MRAVILAGGKGTRLRPYTTFIPKPLVPIGGEMPILELIIRQLVNEGFDHITIAVNHLSELIMAFFQDGKKWGIQIDYSIEDLPLGTIGPLSLIEDLPENFLVMNGDILSDISYSTVLRNHITSNASVTVCSFKRKSKIDFGVLEINANSEITNFIEKPVYNFLVSMGIYALSKSVVQSLEKGKSYGFDDLMLDGIRENKKYRSFVYEGFWLDIGRPEDYDYCNENYDTIKEKFGNI